MNVNTRLDNIIRDSVFTSRLTFMSYSSNDLVCPLPDTTLDRFCLQILSQIHHKIECLNLEPLSMDRILLGAEYSNLCELGLYNIQEETAILLLNVKKSRLQ
jgi:hypothetical protein